MKKQKNISGMIQNLFNALFGTNSRPDLGQEQEAATVTIENSSPSVSVQPEPPQVKGKYAADVEALEANYGSLCNTGLCISLQDLLQICPRNRKRIESYQGLVNYLKAEYGATLTIKSRKTKWGFGYTKKSMT